MRLTKLLNDMLRMESARHNCRSPAKAGIPRKIGNGLANECIIPASYNGVNMPGRARVSTMAIMPPGDLVVTVRKAK